MPRRTSLTPAVSKALCDAMRTGLCLSHAAALVGISPATVREWIRRGEGTDDRPDAEPFATFATAMRKARADGDVAMVAVINSAAEDGQWRAAAWMLERRNPQQWGRGAQRIEERAPSGRFAAPGHTAEALIEEIAARMAREKTRIGLGGGGTGH